jgi:hypothetical protein
VALASGMEGSFLGFAAAEEAYPAGKAFATLRAFVHSGDEAGVVASLPVHTQQLLLPETLGAGWAGEGLLSRVRAHMDRHMPLLEKGRNTLTQGRAPTFILQNAHPPPGHRMPS